MPELPEVEAARAAIAENCIGKKIVKVIIADDDKVINGVSPSQFQSSLLGKTIVSVHRKGKNMWIRLDSPPFPSFQFGMAGAVYIKGVAVTKYKRSAVNDADEWPSKFSKFFIELNDGLEMSFTDKRRFAKVRLLDDPASVPPISELGPDALLEPMTEGEFNNSLSRKKIAIKTLLLDQNFALNFRGSFSSHCLSRCCFFQVFFRFLTFTLIPCFLLLKNFISGIGNWIADEVLYQARIHPLQNASSLSGEDSARLLKCIKEVVQHAVEVDADSCLFPFDWLFHFRWGKKPGNVEGKKIDFISVGGRTSAYVPELQMLNEVQSTKAPAKPRKQAAKKTKDNDDNHNANTDENERGSEDSVGLQEEARTVKSKETKATRSSGRTTATMKRNSQERSNNGGKKVKRESFSTKSDDHSDSDADGGDGEQKGPLKGKAKKTQKQSRRNVS